MLTSLKEKKFVKKIVKNPTYNFLRQYFPMADWSYTDDRDKLAEISAEVIRIEWPEGKEKPKIGIIKDFGLYPRWTKYCRFLDNNSFEYDFFNIHAHDWIENSGKFDLFIGLPSSEYYHLDEIRIKYYVLETLLGKTCYPSLGHVNLYEHKSLEAYISKAFDLPFAKTYVSHDKKDALQLVEKLTYPLVSKIVPSSGSVGIELVRDQKHGRRIVEQAFSSRGRRIHLAYLRQKNYIYFQDYIPYDGYDIRVIVVGNWVFGYYRKALEGDFRASGMDRIEKRSLPEKSMKIALELNEVIKSPQLVVDMLHGLDGEYYIIEVSPFCKMEKPEQLSIDDVPGVYIFDEGAFHFEKGRFWAHELALREFFLKDFLPKKFHE